MSDEIIFNGVNGATGDYLFPPLPVEDAAAVARGETLDPETLQALEAKIQSEHGTLAPGEGLKADQLDSVGWGIVFPATTDAKVLARQDAILDALAPLLQLRKKQASALYQEFRRDKAPRPNESAERFVRRFGAAADGIVAEPDKVPYYLLLVGTPEEIPYAFQFALGVTYAVGRLAFKTLDEYAAYAASVVAAENGLVLPRRAALFGVQNKDDLATGLSSDKLVRGLAKKFADTVDDWTFDTLVGEGQTEKARLAELMGGANTPALLFTASHGMGFPNGHKLQELHQGALLCQDWPGPRKWQEPIPEGFYFSGTDVGNDARLLGMIAFYFACYGAGTPKLDAFAKQATGKQKEIAPDAFLAGLPLRMLGHPKGGALAVIGHVERAWDYSFQWNSVGQLGVFDGTLRRLFQGDRVGWAFDYFSRRYAALSTSLSREVEDIKFGKEENPAELAGMWTANNDARNYMILGDPAVKLSLGEANAVPSKQREIETMPHVEMAVMSESTAPAQTTKETSTTLKQAKTKKAASTTGKGKKKKDADAHNALASTATEFAQGTVITLQIQVADTRTMEATAFGVSESVGEMRDRLVKTLKEFTDKVGTALEAGVKDVSELKVETYVNDQLAGLSFEQLKTTNPFDTARLKIQSAIGIDGDTRVVVPAELTTQDRAIVELHSEMVGRAQANRAEMLKMAFSAFAGLIDVVKGG